MVHSNILVVILNSRYLGQCFYFRLLNVLAIAGNDSIEHSAHTGYFAGGRSYFYKVTAVRSHEGLTLET